MNLEDALSFLRANSPMPRRPDPVFLEVFYEVLEVLTANPRDECLAYLVNAFGNWPDYTIYEKIQGVLRNFAPSVVHPHLLQGLQSRSKSVRSWCAHTLKYFPSQEFLPILEKMLSDPSLLVRLAAAIGLEHIAGLKTAEIARRFLKTEKDPDIREVLASIINARYRQ